MPRACVALKQDQGRVMGQAERGTPAGAADEAGLMGAVATGDPSAFKTLVDRHLPGMVAVARRMLRDDAEAEDIAQDAFLRLWRSASSLEVTDAGVRPWLRRVVSNLCIDRVRGSARVTVTDEVPEVPVAPRQQAALEAEETRKRVDAALKELPERQRLALTLFHYEGMSQIEIGRVMGISDEAVESLLARARRQLKTALRPEWRGMIENSNGS
jgi:RNA polymerase sigma-70 factor (ECF subfamily)